MSKKGIRSGARSLLLLSGGLDSAVCLGILQESGDEIHALTFRYGQTHIAEVDRAVDLAARFGVESHLIVGLPIRDLVDSLLTGNGESVVVPSRNAMFLSAAHGYAQTIDAQFVYFGPNATDHGPFPDCRPVPLQLFWGALNAMADIRHTGPKLMLPLVRYTKADVVRRAEKLGIDIEETLSCYRPTDGGEACGACFSCQVGQEAGA